MLVLLALEEICIKVGTVRGGWCSLANQLEPPFRPVNLGLRIRRIHGILVMDIRSYLVKVGLWRYHPVNGEVELILPVHFPLVDTIPRRTLAPSMALLIKLSNPPIACGKWWKFPLMPKLLQLRWNQVTTILPHGNDLVPNFRGIGFPPLTRMRNSIGPCSIRRKHWRTADGDDILCEHGWQASSWRPTSGGNLRRWGRRRASMEASESGGGSSVDVLDVRLMCGSDFP